MFPSFSCAEELAVIPHEVGEKENNSQKAGDLQQRGQQLRAALEQRYKDLSQRRELKPKNSINDLIAKYIPIGMSFNDAEVILRGAGVTYHYLNDPPAGQWHDTPHLVGTINIPTAWFAKVEVVIGIYPKTPKDFHSPVGEAGGFIDYATL